MKWLEIVKAKSWAVPGILLLLSVLAYGLMAPFLGFYQDDWHFIFYYITRGSPGLVELMNYDGHPLSAWIYVVLFPLLGTSPAVWQLFSVFWRWLASIFVWKLLNQLWPNHVSQTFTATLFFLLYPVFILQSQALVYFEIWISYVFLIGSFYYAGKGISEKKPLYHGIGFFLKILHLFTSAYVTGLEFARPFLIWIQLPKDDRLTFRDKFWKVIQLWMPYFIINFVYIAWRVFFYNSPVEKRADPVIIFSIINRPVETIQLLLNNLFPDLILMLVSSWYPILTPSIFKYSSHLNWLLFVILVISSLLTWLFLRKITPDSEQEEAKNLPIDAMWMGGLFLLFGLTPYYAIGYFMHEKMAPWNGRVALGSLIGAGLIVSILISALVTSPRRKNIFIAVLAALLVGWQVRSANDFRTSWEKQQNFYQQILWRIPALEENTAIFSEQEILPLMGDYPTSFALNALYARQTPVSKRKIPYWFFTSTGNFWDKEKALAAGMPISDQQHSVYFSGESTKSILIRFEPERRECLWVLRPQDIYSRSITPRERTLASMSDLSRIKATPAADLHLQNAFHSPPRRWCYFYQKADLARQFENWETVVELWQQAHQAGQRPANGFEYLPFIEAYARTGEWKLAADLTKKAHRASPAMYHSLCPLWQDITKTTLPSPQKDKIIREMVGILKCTPSSFDLPASKMP
jgi:hypothetical protein